MTAARSLRKNVHYEVQGCRSTRWTVIDVQHDDVSARESAEKLWKEESYRAIRVMCEKYDTGTNTYKSIEIHCLGQKPKASPKKPSAPAGVCWKPGDLYSVEGRRTLTHLLRPYLERAQVAPSELLHCPEYYTDLDNSGTELQNAVQRASIDQIRLTDESIQERMKKLYRLVEQAVSALREDWKAGHMPDISKTSWRQTLATLDENENRSYLLTCSLSGYLRDLKTIPEKFEQLFKLINFKDPDWVFPVLDTLLAEFLNFPVLIKHIFGERDCLGDLLNQMIALLKGDFVPVAKEAGGAEDGEANNVSAAERLNELFSLKAMTRCKRVIFKSICRELDGTRPMSDGSLYSELNSLSDFLGAMRGPEGNNKLEERMLEAASARSSRLLNTHAISEYLMEATSPVQSARMLLELSEHAIGDGSLKKIAAEIEPIINSPRNEPYFRGMDGPFLERMQTVTRLQARCVRSKLLDNHKLRIADKLDDDCIYMMKKNSIFARIAKSSQEPHVAGHKLLGMLADGYFTLGKAQDFARQQARTYMRQPDFIEKCIGDGTAQDKAGKMLVLKQLMTKAGMANVGKD